MQAARNRQILQQKQGLQFGDAMESEMDDLSAMMDNANIGGKKRKSRAKSGKSWVDFLQYDLKKHGKDMGDFRKSQALRDTISRDWKAYKRNTGGAFGEDDDEYDDDDDDFGGGVIGGARRKRVVRKRLVKKPVRQTKRKIRGGALASTGIQVCQDNLWKLDPDGNIIGSHCLKKVQADPEKPYSINFTDKFEYYDEDMEKSTTPIFAKQQQAASKIRAATKAAMENAEWPDTVRLNKPKRGMIDADKLFREAISSVENSNILVQAAKKAYISGDSKRIERVKADLVQAAKMEKLEPVEGTRYRSKGPSSSAGIFGEIMSETQLKAIEKKKKAELEKGESL